MLLFFCRKRSIDSTNTNNAQELYRTISWRTPRIFSAVWLGENGGVCSVVASQCMGETISNMDAPRAEIISNVLVKELDKSVRFALRAISL